MTWDANFGFVPGTFLTVTPVIKCLITFVELMVGALVIY